MEACSNTSAIRLWTLGPTSTESATAFPSLKLNQFGGSFGGPVVIPQVYNGRNKTFFFVDYEGSRRSTQAFILGNVPTVRMRNGDFGETATIYDPLTTVPNPNVSGGFLRTPFANNIIPVGRRDPIAMKMINAYPLPTGPGRINNYSSSQTIITNSDSGDVRVDEQTHPKRYDLRPLFHSEVTEHCPKHLSRNDDSWNIDSCPS